MAKGYWIPHLDVSDADGFQAYRSRADAWHEHNGSMLLARAGRSELVEGKMRSRNVLREFDSFEAALAGYRSPEYSAARPLRAPHSRCDFIIAEGHDGAQPTIAATAPPAAARRGYWIVHIDVRDAEGYKPYMTACQAPFGAFGARYLVRGGRQELVEGAARGRTVVVQFPSYDAALACYRSDGYQAAKNLRHGKAEFDLIVIEGLDEPKI